MRLIVARRQMWRSYMALRGMRQRQQHTRTRGHDIENLGRPAVLLQPARHPDGKSYRIDCQRIRKRCIKQVANGIRGGGAEIIVDNFGRKRGIKKDILQKWKFLRKYYMEIV